MTSASPSLGADGVQFTPEVIEEIKDLVAQGISRDEIASRLGVSVGYLQVTCLRLGISLRRIILPNGSGRHTADVMIAHVREQKEVSQLGGRPRRLPSARNFVKTFQSYRHLRYLVIRVRISIRSSLDQPSAN